MLKERNKKLKKNTSHNFTSYMIWELSENLHIYQTEMAYSPDDE